MLLPGQGDDWDGMELGHKQPQEFPSGQYKFMVNEIEGIGRCQNAFAVFTDARIRQPGRMRWPAAEAFLRDLMTPAVADSSEPVDEELLGRIMRGEDTPEIDMQALDEGRLVETGGQAGTPPGRHRGAGRGYNGVTPRPPGGCWAAAEVFHRGRSGLPGRLAGPNDVYGVCGCGGETRIEGQDADREPAHGHDHAHGAGRSPPPWA